ncbi:MAG: SDR family oxidoreductase [Terrimonas ferruginea]|uniref:NAD(P)-dependent oxidoreductase n=1 Tax=Terrimonas ferruginea TaxID=249 RepID=UPI000929D6C6|nr:SDR family oxidoreductase [Terrimonas ferruginea]MBN8782116.1 SDR family oxidoreductase [Terrimonas ferruginea]OJW42660.1 MAG: epimerase [Sphingobacteriales bacterium 48-107]
MELLIIGATGTTGREVVKQALSLGHRVTAFSRNPEPLRQIRHHNLQLMSGDVMDAISVEKAVRGKDAVLSTLGAGRKGTIRSEGTRHVIEAMQKNKVRRFICQTTLGAGDSRVHLNFFWKHIMFGLMLREAYRDHEVQERYIMNSNLDWTIVRPAALTDGPATGQYRHGFGEEERGLKLKVSRQDVALFMLMQLSSEQYVHQAPGLSY